MKGKWIDLLCACLIVCALMLIPGYGQVASMAGKLTVKPVVVIDPGHGGIDGGAQSRSGVSEKDINLAIAKRLAASLKKDSVKVIMTRNRDEGLYEDMPGAAIRTLKSQDMRERKRIIDEAGADLVISIHLNSFTEDTSVHGAQVFYPSAGDEKIAEESRRAAEIIQAGLNEQINTQKARTELGKNDVFLLQQPSSPIVIVECGFLSNEEDARNLQEAAYQKRISKVLQKSVRSYTGL